MKTYRWLKCGSCLACLFIAGNMYASPQSDSVTITAVVTDDSGQDGKSGQEGPKERKAIRLQVNPGPVVLMKRLSLTTDDQKAGDERQAEKANQVAEDQGETPPDAWLGIGLKAVEGDLATYLGSSDGVFVQSIFPDSPAMAGKVQEGDIIVQFNGKKVGSPAELIDALRAIKTNAAENTGDNKSEKADSAIYPTVTVSVLRRGKEERLELTPSSRPKDLKIARGDESSKWLDVFKFGQPDEAGLNVANPFTQLKNNVVIVFKEDGQETIARIERDGDGPAKITVTQGNEERQLTEDQLDQLPEKVREAVQNALKAKHSFEFKSSGSGTSDAVREQIEKAVKQAGGTVDVQIQELRDLSESLKGLGKGKVIMIDPEKLQEMTKVPEEARAQVKKWADSQAQQARGLSTMPEQLKSLKKEVDELKQQVEELRSQLKASKE